MYADEQDRISASDGSAPSTGRPIIIDIVVVSIVLLVVVIVAYQYFSDFEPDYSTVKYSDDESYSSNPGETTTLTLNNLVSENLMAPAPLDDAELQEKYDLPEQPPELNDSDDDLLTQLQGLTSLKGIVAWSDAADLARRFVVLIYNLAEGEVAHKSLPLNNPDSTFSANGQGASLRIAAASYQRYDAYAEAFASMDSERAVAIYRFFWPALNSAFAELGEPKKSLHNEAMKALDHLLATPDIGDEIKLVQPAVYYRYADPELERLSAAQKQMLRLGAKNRALIKAKLQEIKELLLNGQSTLTP